MTTDKKLKRAVRSRMSKTGERYAAARRCMTGVEGEPGGRPPEPGLLPGYRRVGGPIAELSALANALAALGVRAPHTGEPYDEAMLLGLGGGVGGGYFLFQYGGTPSVAVIGTRHSWQDSSPFLTGTLRRIGSRAEVFETGGARAGRSALEKALAAGTPVLAWTDRASLPYMHLPEPQRKWWLHVVGVCGRDPDSGEILVDDRGPRPFRVDEATFTQARGLIATSKHRLILADPPAVDVDLAEAVLDALREGHRERTEPKIRNFGLPALEKWASLLTNQRDPKGWPAVMGQSSDLFLAIRLAVEAIEGGTGGGAYRLLHADFLDQAAAVTGRDKLREVADRYRALAAEWDALVDVLVPTDVSPLRRWLDLDRRKRRVIEEGGRSSQNEVAPVSAQISAVIAELASQNPMPPERRRAMFADLEARIRTIHSAEMEATQAIAAIAG